MQLLLLAAVIARASTELKWLQNIFLWMQGSGDSRNGDRGQGRGDRGQAMGNMVQEQETGNRERGLKCKRGNGE